MYEEICLGGIRCSIVHNGNCRARHLVVDHQLAGVNEDDVLIKSMLFVHNVFAL